jgi:type II secretory pathway pseudopilin PulG
MKKTTDRPATVPTSLEPCTGSAPAFTLPELLVILAVLMVLGVMVLPALARSGLNSRAFQCLNNSRQLCAAWRTYADDNQDRMVFSSDDGRGGLNPSNAYAWTLTHLDFNSANRANWDPTVDIMTRPLWQYNKSVNIYRCPSDLSYVVVGGVSKPRVRSMSMNFFLGGFAGGSAANSVGVSAWGNLYPVYFKVSDLNSHASPGPADTFVFIDERSDAINWGCYLTDMSGYPNRLYPKAAPTLYEFNQDLPGFLHDLAASVSFADGRAEFHRWLDPRTTPPLQLGGVLTGGKGGGEILPAPYDPDVAWLQAHAARPK